MSESKDGLLEEIDTAQSAGKSRLETAEITAEHLIEDREKFVQCQWINYRLFFLSARSALLLGLSGETSANTHELSHTHTHTLVNRRHLSNTCITANVCLHRSASPKRMLMHLQYKLHLFTDAHKHTHTHMQPLILMLNTEAVFTVSLLTCACGKLIFSIFLHRGDNQ